MAAPRLIAIGDIHGCSRALDALLAQLALSPDDRLVTLGDYVDRGPDSRGVLDRIIELSEAGQLIALRGNHELMMCRARSRSADERFWRACGGDQALASYALGGRPGKLNDVPDAHWKFLASTCADHYLTDGHIFVHAGVAPGLDLSEQSEDALFWLPLADRGPHISGKTVICGHTEQRTGLPLDLGHTICIDTLAYAGGWLSALDVNTFELWQANQSGNSRRLELRS